MHNLVMDVLFCVCKCVKLLIKFYNSEENRGRKNSIIIIIEMWLLKQSKPPPPFLQHVVSYLLNLSTYLKTSVYSISLCFIRYAPNQNAAA
jgi:hypothetical protein